jgi:hypothetical protein
MLAPELVDEDVARNDAAVLEEEEGEKRPLTLAAQWNRTISTGDLEWPEDPELPHSYLASTPFVAPVRPCFTGVFTAV